MRKVTKLETTAIIPVKRKRVAAYARVSSGKDAQFHSLSAQISYYNSYIGSRGDWELAGIYADEAMTGTKADRPQFQQLLADCRAGKIDMVITKSVTRLARNTVILLKTARELKELGIDIYFEKENIHTLSADGELMLALLASYAQEESRSVSENMKWRIRKKFEQGLATTCNILGYRLEDGIFRIVPEEAEIVRQIYDDYLSGMGLNAIAKKLRRMGVPTKRNTQWSQNSVYHILRQEKYTGDLVLQTTYRKDHISKKQVKNNGELPMYYVEDAHEAIIDKETFSLVRQELARRAGIYRTPRPAREPYVFTSLIRCGMCGRHFYRKPTASGKKYAKKPAWLCKTAMNYGKASCPAQRIPDSILVAKTSEVLATTDWNRETLIQTIAEIQAPGHNRLVYVFRDGHTQEVAWQHRSRRESWTDEMKQKAREKALKNAERRRKNASTN